MPGAEVLVIAVRATNVGAATVRNNTVAVFRHLASLLPCLAVSTGL